MIYSRFPKLLRLLQHQNSTIYRVSGANRFSHSMASPCTAFTPSDSLATANNS